MTNYSMNIMSTSPNHRGFNADGPWGGASWDGILNVGMSLYNKRIADRKIVVFKVVDHNPIWKHAAGFEIRSMTRKLSQFTWFKDLQHIGSTSIEGMAAKPLIDLMLGVTDDVSAKTVDDQLTSLGWVHGKNHFYNKIVGFQRYCIHLCGFNSPYWRARIIFRDHFRNHPEEIETYANLKRHNHSLGLSFEEYTDAKQYYIYSIVKQYGFSDEEMLLGGVVKRLPDDTSIRLPGFIGAHGSYYNA